MGFVLDELHSCSSRCDKTDEQVADDHRSHHDAESTAKCADAVAVKLAAQGRSNQLVEHLKRIERELDSAEWLWQEWIKVRL